MIAGASRMSGLLEQLADLPAVRVLLRPPMGFEPSQWLHGVTVGSAERSQAGSGNGPPGAVRLWSVQIGCTFLVTPRPSARTWRSPRSASTLLAAAPSPARAPGEPDAEVVTRLVEAAATLGQARSGPSP